MIDIEVAIIGAGPAGISAAINLAKLNRNIIMFDTVGYSEKINKAERIQNYPGIVDITGEQMKETLMEQVCLWKIPVCKSKVSNIIKRKKGFFFSTESEDYYAKSLIISAGVNITKELEGESEYLGKGVSYCATCDGSLYRGRKIAVINKCLDMDHEVVYLAQMADSVYFDNKTNTSASLPSNVVELKASVLRILGDNKVHSVELVDHSIVEVDGVFILKKTVAPNMLLTGIEVENGHIVVDRYMKTNMEGCFAAGDCTGRPYQIAKAVGEGNIAAHEVVKLLSN